MSIARKRGDTPLTNENWYGELKKAKAEMGIGGLLDTASKGRDKAGRLRARTILKEWNTRKSSPPKDSGMPVAYDDLMRETGS